MTQFQELKTMYNQFFNIADEINSLIEKEEFNEAVSRLNYKNKLVKKFITLRKNTNLNAEERTKIVPLEKEFIKREKENVERLKAMQSEVKTKLKQTNKSIKVNNAYSFNTKQQGSIADFVE